MTFIIIFVGIQLGKKRGYYTKKFKVETVRLVVEEGQRIFDVARELVSGGNYEDLCYD